MSPLEDNHAYVRETFNSRFIDGFPDTYNPSFENMT